MTKDEFLKYFHELPINLSALGGLPISDDDYKIIEYVYTYHPSISNKYGKEQIAYLYKNFGLAVIHDMYPRAKLVAEEEKAIQRIRNELSLYERELSKFKEGSHEYDDKLLDKCPAIHHA